MARLMKSSTNTRRASALLLLGLGLAAGFAPPARGALAHAPAPRARRGAAVTLNIFEKAASSAASALGKGLGKVAGMPDMSDAEQKAMEKAMLEGTINFDQFLIQMSVITKAGSIAQLASKIPGMGDKIDPRTAAAATEKLKRYETFIGQMTAEERADPSLVLPASPGASARVQRVAKAAGVDVQDVAQFIGEFVVMRATSQAMAQGKKPEEIEAAMMGAQTSLGMLNRAERRMNAKEKKGKPKSSKGFGAPQA